MPAFLLDSSVLIDTLNNRKSRAQLLRGLVSQGHLLACCSINVTEVYAGMRPPEELRTAELLGSLRYYPVTWPIARLAGLLKRDHAKQGITLATTDVTIAAVAIHHQLTLVTDNLKHYPMKELQLYPLPN
ncbi:MAG TPA: type II toxin-antitoxin system VapC family toxin [Bryobacteraceae bacterium]|nr:type II toxin-antitoxin system VapC family toxin [Bryobacteraceae bacterium]